jgi:hypothetical protein
MRATTGQEYVEMHQNVERNNAEKERKREIMWERQRMRDRDRDGAHEREYYAPVLDWRKRALYTGSLCDFSTGVVSMGRLLFRMSHTTEW